MGDTGAMFIGLLLGAMTMIEQYPSDHAVSLLTPVFILGIPIFDTLFVMYIRYMRGLPVFWGSPDHIAIRLRHWGMSVPQIVVTSCIATAALGGIGLLMLVTSEEVAWSLCVGTIGALLCLTLVLRKVDVRKPSEPSVAIGRGGGTRAA
jgi:UDP-GlcNAc:undecaprenyl-phosphate GlcNAc-1-phosphate transferase